MVFDARGTVADTIAVRDAIAKKYAGRRIPLHPDLKRACYDRSCVIATSPARRSAPALSAPTASSIGSLSSSLNWASTADGLLRQTVYVGLREDKPADQVRRE
jgi:hypothetical protein